MVLMFSFCWHLSPVFRGLQPPPCVPSSSEFHSQLQLTNLTPQPWSQTTCQPFSIHRLTTSQSTLTQTSTYILMITLPHNILCEMQAYHIKRQSSRLISFLYFSSCLRSAGGCHWSAHITICVWSSLQWRWEISQVCHNPSAEGVMGEKQQPDFSFPRVPLF